MVDKVASRYGKWPHEVVALDFPDFILALRCCYAGLRKELPYPVVLMEKK
jgi:hypothetical protein